MPIKAIVFDFDGVLADSEMLHLRVYRELLGPSGVNITTERYYERYLGSDDEGVFRQVAIDYGLLLGDEEIELLIQEKAQRFEALVSSADVMYPGAAACVRRLAAEWPLGIASGARRSEIELMLGGAGLSDVFRFIVAAGDTDNGKPAPDPYLRAAELHALPPAACVAIEDSHAGLESARGAGMRTIGIATTYPRQTLIADAVIDSLDEVTARFVREMGA
ncbi:MAG TPA: HAD family phosphatase [Vicinamibacterales bacterium]|nr:HAD family phosphatase [Vicinamibacterales bacterium]